MALSRHRLPRSTCPLFGVKRTSAKRDAMSANDPKRDMPSPTGSSFKSTAPGQAGGVMNWHAETNFAVTIAGGSIGGLCAGVALRGIGAEVHIYERVAGPMETRGAGIVVQGDLVHLLRQHHAPDLPMTACRVRRYLDPAGLAPRKQCRNSSHRGRRFTKHSGRLSPTIAITWGRPFPLSCSRAVR